MKKLFVRSFFMLFITLAVTELINGIIIFYFGEMLPHSGYYLAAVLSVVMYFIIGIGFSKIGNDKSRKYVLITMTVLIMFSCPFSMIISIATGQYYMLHMMICSPIANLFATPFEETSNWELIISLLSPISVLLIWLFSKIGDRKKKQSDSDI